MLVGGGGNVTVQMGNDGVLLVDTNLRRARAENHGGHPKAFRTARFAT